MSETFTKLFSSITDSTIWNEPHATRLVWITMLAMADRNGYVGASIPGLAARARVSVDEAEEAINKFLGPDKYSRSQEHEGRRIEATDRGWTLLNYDRFRDMRDEEARREYERNRKREQRARIKQNMSRDVPQSPALSAQAEAEAEAEKKNPLKSPRGTDRYSGAFSAFWAMYPKKVGKDAAWRAWRKLKPDLNDVVGAIQWQRESAAWRKDGGAYIPNPATYLNQGRWKDEKPTRPQLQYRKAQPIEVKTKTAPEDRGW